MVYKYLGLKVMKKKCLGQVINHHPQGEISLVKKKLVPYSRLEVILCLHLP